MAGNILEQITEQYHSLTRSGKRLADYIFANAHDSQYLSISSLAENSGVSECGYYINGTNGGYVYFYASASIVSILCTVRLDAEIYS